MEYEGYLIITKKYGNGYLAEGRNGNFRESSHGEDEEDAIKHLKIKINMAKAYIKGQEILKK
ncbi:hypothetical protein [Inediibacterium massiliense]|uniref:hypothetical protein n=1 Tax=Inediibacterium massiliense TaxID=1658111 RepID=UPI0006B4455F|nr:hypothetical protein [Inediibacterium massiliense]